MSLSLFFVYSLDISLSKCFPGYRCLVSMCNYMFSELVFGSLPYIQTNQENDSYLC